MVPESFLEPEEPSPPPQPEAAEGNPAAMSVPVVFRPRAATGGVGRLSLWSTRRGGPVVFLVALRDARDELVAGRGRAAWPTNAPAAIMKPASGRIAA